MKLLIALDSALFIILRFNYELYTMTGSFVVVLKCESRKTLQ